MQDQVAAGLFVLDGSARVRTDDGLVRLDSLGSGGGGSGVDPNVATFSNNLLPTLLV